jgi:hypothetical protein
MLAPCAAGHRHAQQHIAPRTMKRVAMFWSVAGRTIKDMKIRYPTQKLHVWWELNLNIDEM